MQKKQTKKSEEIKNTIIPLADRVLIRPMTVQEAEGKKASLNFILPESMTSEKSAQGKVLAVGEGKYVDGKLQPVKVKVGDVVLFSKYSYDEVSSNGEDLFLLKEDNILAILK